jgi:hypothetical protein
VVIWGRPAINGELLCSVKAATAITTTIATSAPMRAKALQLPSRSLRLAIGYFSRVAATMKQVRTLATIHRLSDDQVVLW